MNVNHGILAIVRRQTRIGVPIVEEVVESTTVGIDVRHVLESQTPGSRAIERQARSEGRIAPCGLGDKGSVRWRITLEVCRLVLDVAHPSIFAVHHLIVVQG